MPGALFEDLRLAPSQESVSVEGNTFCASGSTAVLKSSAELSRSEATDRLVIFSSESTAVEHQL